MEKIGLQLYTVRQCLTTESELCLGGYEVTMFKTRGVQLYAPHADNALVNETLKNLEGLKCTE